MKPGRNDPCPCGSGKKFKKCCQQADSNLSRPQPASSKDQELNRLIALFNSGRLDELVFHAQAMSGRFPSEGLIWKLLGLGLLMQGKNALLPLKKAAGLLPEDAEMHNYLGIALTSQECYEEAITAFQKALIVRPHYPEALYNQNLAYMAQGRPADAKTVLQRALTLQPDYAMAHYGLGLALKAEGDLPQAESSLRKALSLKPDFAGGHYTLGYLLMEQSRHTEAESSFRQALDIEPAYHEARIKLSLCLSESGRFSEAETGYRQVLASAPNNVDARFNLAMITSLPMDDENTEALLALEKAHREGSSPMADSDWIMLNYALGRTFENMGNYDIAFDYYSEGAQRKRASFNYDPQHSSERFSHIARIFSREIIDKLAGSGDPSPTPIFILGMPRSGTTLVEQIISNHPDVSAAGELPYLMDISTGTIGGQEHLFPQSLPYLDKPTLATMGAEYIKRIKYHDENAHHITDKQPVNFIAIGLIHLILPNARIIHVRRDPMDTCLSCYTQLFQGHMEFSYDLSELGQYYRDYLHLMRHWREVLPAHAFVEIDYEDLVRDPESAAKKMIESCGLKWHPQCLDFSIPQRAIRTASVMQARQPIYRSSVERWRKYETRLAPLRDSLFDSGQRT